jgi:hypothetical protein
MTKSDKRQLLRLLSLVVGLIGLLGVTRIASATFHTRPSTRTAHVNSTTSTIPLVIDCDGDACGQVTLSWDDTKQEYKVQNNSTGQWVRVDAANLAATATTCVAAGKTEYLSLKSITGAYHARYDATCANPVE